MSARARPAQRDAAAIGPEAAADDPEEVVSPDPPTARSPRGGPTEAERLARRRAQYSGAMADRRRDRRTG